LLVHALGSLLALSGRVVLAELSIGVRLGALEERSLGDWNVLSLALPRLQDSVLKGAGIRERHVPWVGLLVHGVQVQGRLKLRLAAGQEHDARHGRRHTAAQHLQGVLGNLGRAGPVGAVSAWGNHGGLQQNTLEHDLVVGHVLEGLRPDRLLDLKAAVDVMLAVQQNLRLDNWHQTSVL
ncbi:hypothetical protein Vafri_2646, partial [Volvox africanus]